MLWCRILPSEYSSKDECFSTEDYVEDLLNHAARQKAQHPGNLLLSLIPPRAEETFFALIFMKSSPVFPSPGVQIHRNFFRYLYCLLKIAIFGFLINSVHLFNEKCLRIFYLIPVNSDRLEFFWYLKKNLIFKFFTVRLSVLKIVLWD